MSKFNNKQQQQQEEIVNKNKNIICIVLATDGVWDNWNYENVNKFVFDKHCLQALENSNTNANKNNTNNANNNSANNDGAQKIALSFMQKNAIFSKRNFGSQADNATGIVMYLTFDESF
jgi:hypothetical protein